MNKLNAQIRRLLEERGWDRDKYEEAVRHDDENGIIKHHPSQYMTQAEVEATW